MSGAERRRGVIGALVSAVCVMALSGCGTAVSTSAGSVSAAPAASAVAASVGALSRAPWTSCRAEAGTALGAGSRRLPITRIPAGFVSRSAVWCSSDMRTNADGSEDLLGLDQRTTQPAAVAHLVAVLRLPDEPPSSAPCDLVGFAPPLLFLLDARGNWVRPPLPTDGCGFPRAAALAAVARTPRRTVASWFISQTESAGAARTGCSEQWSDLIHVQTAYFHVARPLPLTADPFAGIARVRVCLYAVPRNQLGSLKPAGSFIEGVVVSGTSRGHLGSLLTGLPKAPACRREATQFAVITQLNVGRDPMAYVELDGCRRVMVETSVTTASYSRQRDALSQASGSLVTYLDGVRSPR